MTKKLRELKEKAAKAVGRHGIIERIKLSKKFCEEQNGTSGCKTCYTDFDEILDLLGGEEGKIDHTIDVRYEPDAIQAFDKFIKKWCGGWYGHLVDSDENDGEFMRQKIRELKENPLVINCPVGSDPNPNRPLHVQGGEEKEPRSIRGVEKIEISSLRGEWVITHPISPGCGDDTVMSLQVLGKKINELIDIIAPSGELTN